MRGAYESHKPHDRMSDVMSDEEHHLIMCQSARVRCGRPRRGATDALPAAARPPAAGGPGRGPP